jgi:hypothetical protein
LVEGQCTGSSMKKAIEREMQSRALNTDERRLPHRSLPDLVGQSREIASPTPLPWIIRSSRMMTEKEETSEVLKTSEVFSMITYMNYFNSIISLVSVTSPACKRYMYMPLVTFLPRLSFPSQVTLKYPAS